MYSCPTLNTNNSGEMTLLDILNNNYTRGGDWKEDNSRRRRRLCGAQAHSPAPPLYRNFLTPDSWIQCFKEPHGQAGLKYKLQKLSTNVDMIQDLCWPHPKPSSLFKGVKALSSLCGKKWNLPFCDLPAAEALAI